LQAAAYRLEQAHIDSVHQRQISWKFHEYPANEVMDGADVASHPDGCEIILHMSHREFLAVTHFKNGVYVRY
jgi:hypothetical protein